MALFDIQTANAHRWT